MTDNIRPDHYRKGEIDLYEAFSQIFPHNEYRAGMQMIAMRYMFRDKIDRVEDLKKAIYSLERLKEKEIEYKEAQEKEKALEYELANLGEALRGIDTSENIHNQKAGEYSNWTYLDHTDLLKQLLYDDYLYLTRDRDGVLYASDGEPYKVEDLGFWDVKIIFDREPIQNDDFPEVQWHDEEPTTIAGLLYIYGNGGENGNVED